jgi:WD40 repeat protein
MASDLHWHIDDDEGDGPWRPKPAPPAPRRPFPRTGFLLALSGMAILVLSVWGLFAWRGHQWEAEQSAAVLRVAQLEDRLLAAGDLEALATVQDSQAPGWVTWRTQLSGLDVVAPLSDTQPVEIVWAWTGTSGWNAGNLYTLAGGPEYGEVHVTGERATLDVTRRWRLYAAPGAQAFAVRETQAYRFDEERRDWIRTAPPAAPDGELLHIAAKTLDVRYPAADEATLGPLLPRLEVLAAQACADIGCPRSYPRLVLSADPQTMVNGIPSNQRSAPPIVYAPAPSLLGTPLDDAGLEALYRAYGVRIVRSIVSGANRSGSAMPDTWLLWELARLNIETSPFSDEDLRVVARAAMTNGLDPLVSPGTQDDGWWLALDFLAQSGGANPIVDVLAAAQNAPPTTMLARAVNAHGSAWWDYLEAVATLPVESTSTARLAVSCNGQLRLWNASNSALRPLGVGAGLVMWAPLGTRLAVRSGMIGVTVLDFRDGRTYTGYGRFRAQTPMAWRPDEGVLAVEVDGSRYAWKINEIGPPQLAAGTGMLAWSPDGRYLAYATNEGNTPDTQWIYVAAADGANPQRVTHGTRLAWSPDGRYLAATVDNLWGAPVTVYDTANATVTEVLSATTGVRYDLAWSSGAARQLAVATYSGEGGMVQLVDLGRQVLQTWDFTNIPFDLHWSPGGSHVGWALLPTGSGDSELIVATPGQEAFERIARHARPGFTLNWGWSPDGQWLAYDDGGVVIRATDGSSTLKLATCAAPAWQP